MAHSTLSGSFVVDSLFIVASVVCRGPVFCALFCYIVLSVSFLVADSSFIVAFIVCGGSVFGSCFVMYYLVSFLVLQSS